MYENVDIIVPKKVPLLKCKEMHGHIRIDLHNTRTGSTERIEQHNVVTTAANEFMWLNYLAYLRNGSAYRPTTVYDGIYGGVFLFADAITGGNMLPLGNNHVVGYAGTSTTISGNRGYYNAAESAFNDTEGVARTVWDWGTAQANGTINAVARTQYDAGNGYFGTRNGFVALGRFCPQNLNVDTYSNHFAPVGFDKANGIAYLFRYSDKTYYKYNYTNNLTINSGGITSSLLIPRSDSLLTSICTSSVPYESYTCRQRWLDVANQTIYAADITTSGTSNDGVVNLYTVDLSQASPSETVTTVTLTGAYLIGGSSDYYEYPVFSDGYMYLSGFNPSDTSEYGIYQVNLSDNSLTFFNTTTTMSGEGYTSISNPRYLSTWGTGGVSVICTGYSGSSQIYREILIEQDGTMTINEPGLSTSNSSDAYCGLGLGAGEDVEMCYIRRYMYSYYPYEQSYIYLPRDYMATYANLSSTVTKTSSETLKMTYTLSDS